VIEQALPWLVREAPVPVSAVVLATGEARDKGWNRMMQERLAPVVLTIRIEPAFGYLADLAVEPALIRSRVRLGVKRLLDSGDERDTVVWAHNLGIGRNLVLTKELLTVCAARGIRVLAHHHDWWFDNRWQRWPDLVAAGFRSTGRVATAIFRSGRTIRHAAINRADASVLMRRFGSGSGWLPNLTSARQALDRAALREARRWLDRRLDGEGRPVWLLPCRLLRRKNVAEGVLLTRWLRPEAWLVVTGGPSSPDEQRYADRLIGAARAGRWRLKLGLLERAGVRTPRIPELLGASEAVVLTSIQEGFGLPYLEAVEAGKPLVARMLPNVGPDLRRFGFRFPHGYDEIWIDPGLFDWQAEWKRQASFYRAWRSRLPKGCRAWAGEPWLLRTGGDARAVPFSRLTLTAQLEVLDKPVAVSWEACVPLNPFLRRWRDLACGGRLQAIPWPRSADRWLKGEPYARRLYRLLQSGARDEGDMAPPEPVQEEFMRAKLASDNLHPLLWALDT
jgi:hypothetical protein